MKPHEHHGASFGHRMKLRGHTQLNSGWHSQAERNIRSVISADKDWMRCEDLNEMFMQKYRKKVFETINSPDVTEEAQAA